MLTVVLEVAEVSEDCVASVVNNDSGLPGVSVLTMVLVTVAGDSVLIEVSVIGEDSELL